MNNFNATEIINRLPAVVSQPILLIGLGLLCIVFCLTSFVLVYHWNHYSIDRSSIVSAQAVYFLGGLLILLIAIVSVILY